MTYDLRPGLRVYTHTGLEIGSIAEVQGDFFKVNAPRRPDFWVQAIDIVAETQEHDGRVAVFALLFALTDWRQPANR